jgi:hypothetical protein
MILREKIIQQLQARRDQFAAFEDSFRDEAKKYLDALDLLALMSSEEVSQRLSLIATPGAVPTPEFDRAPNLCLGFPNEWSNHQQAREWACQVLIDHPTFAVDGSQIKPDDGYSIPVAAVQVAWFENHHARDGRYTKDCRFEVLTPEDLIVEFNGDRVVSEQKVNLRRFELEIELLCETMEKLAATTDVSKHLPIALFDSSLVVSFADRLQEEMQRRHVEAMLRLLRCSEATGIPVVGYVDTSLARDLTNMLAHCFKLNEAQKIHDAGLIDSQMKWGARTPMFVCARGSADRRQEGVLEKFEEFRRGIGFVYLKTSRTAAPARLEIPAWVHERGLLDQVIDLVRAEVIVGNGYPYVIQSADAAAVINSRDREAFYAIFQRFTEEQQIELRISQKAASKMRRR